MNHYFTNNDLKSEIREIKYNYETTPFLFYSDLGVFSKDKIDYGSKFLVECYLKNNKESKCILDMGCGYGFIGIVLSKTTNSEVLCVDINKRAVHLTDRNIEKNKVNVLTTVSDAYKSIQSKYDVIITNPPIHVGKEKVLEILIGAKEYLNSNGELWFVIRKDQGAKSISKLLESYYNLETVDRSKGFYVIKATIK